MKPTKCETFLHKYIVKLYSVAEGKYPVMNAYTVLMFSQQIELLY